MSQAARRSMTLEEFLAWDAGQEGRYEFDGFEPVAMVGGTRAHARIVTNLITALGMRLRGSRCAVFNDSLGIMASGSLRYPDAFVECGATTEANATIAEAPIVVFEVLSPHTAATDSVVKNAEYRATPSIERYVMLAQDRVAATVFERRGEQWVGTLLTEDGAVLEMPEIGITLPLAELYDGVVEPA